MTRLYIWFTPRSRSTALVRCLGHIPKTKIIFEPFHQAITCGPDRITENYAKVIGELPDVTFEYIEKLLQEDFEGYDHVISKDAGFTLNGDMSHIPLNYKHMFLFRRPDLIQSSMHKIEGEGTPEQKATLMKGGFEVMGGKFSTIFTSLVEIYDYVSANSNYKPLVVDAAMIAEKPGETVEKICTFAGLPYHPAILSGWEPLTDFPKEWMFWEPFRVNDKLFGLFNQALASTGLQEHKERTPNPPDGNQNVKLFPEEEMKELQEAYMKLVKLAKDCL